MIHIRIAPVAAFALAVAIAPTAHAELTAEELAKISQNPVGNMVSVPFQYNANMQIAAYYNVVKPDFGPNWQIRAQVQFMFPK